MLCFLKVIRYIYGMAFCVCLFDSGYLMGITFKLLVLSNCVERFGGIGFYT